MSWEKKKQTQKGTGDAVLRQNVCLVLQGQKKNGNRKRGGKEGEKQGGKGRTKKRKGRRQGEVRVGERRGKGKERVSGEGKREGRKGEGQGHVNRSGQRQEDAIRLLGLCTGYEVKLGVTEEKWCMTPESVSC